MVNEEILKEFVSMIQFLFDLDEMEVESLAKAWKSYKESPFNSIEYLPALVKEDRNLDGLFDELLMYMFFLTEDKFREKLLDKLEKLSSKKQGYA